MTVFTKKIVSSVTCNAAMRIIKWSYNDELC